MTGTCARQFDPFDLFVRARVPVAPIPRDSTALPWVYDPLGRITTAPVRGSPGARVVNGYFANDLIASQTIDGVARQTWSLDAIGRFASYTNEAWAVGGDGTAGWQEAVTKVNHYDSDADSPAWIAEDASLPDEITRYVDGLDGNLAAETGKSGGRVLQLIDLHGDVMTTLPIRDGETTADWTALQHRTADEFGNPTDLTTGAAIVTSGQAPGKDGRYGWLGGKQRSADALAGVILMGCGSTTRPPAGSGPATPHPAATPPPMRTHGTTRPKCHRRLRGQAPDRGDDLASSPSDGGISSPGHLGRHGQPPRLGRRLGVDRRHGPDGWGCNGCGERRTANGERRVVSRVVDFGWMAGQMVYNLSVANIHTFVVGAIDSGIVVHNCSFIDPSKVRFSQSTIRRNFSDGSAVMGLAAGLRSGAVKASSIPAVRVLKHRGNLCALDNRRLKAFQSAGVNMPYVVVRKADVTAEWTRKFTTTNRGLSVRWKR